MSFPRPPPPSSSCFSSISSPAGGPYHPPTLTPHCTRPYSGRTHALHPKLHHTPTTLHLHQPYLCPRTRSRFGGNARDETRANIALKRLREKGKYSKWSAVTVMTSAKFQLPPRLVSLVWDHPTGSVQGGKGEHATVPATCHIRLELFNECRVGDNAARAMLLWHNGEVTQVPIAAGASSVVHTIPGLQLDR